MTNQSRSFLPGPLPKRMRKMRNTIFSLQMSRKDMQLQHVSTFDEFPMLVVRNLNLM